MERQKIHVGPQGFQGYLGPQGEDIGTIGPQGLIGTQGPIGAQGSIGVQGNEGPQGLPNAFVNDVFAIRTGLGQIAIPAIGSGTADIALTTIVTNNGWAPLSGGALTVPATGRYRITLTANVLLFPFLATTNYVVITLKVAGTSVSSSQVAIANSDTTFSFQGQVAQTCQLDLTVGDSLILSAVKSAASNTCAISSGFVGFDGAASPAAGLTIVRIA